MELLHTIDHYIRSYERLKEDKIYREESQLPSNTYFIEEDDILALPRDDGDGRYPYGHDGFYFWLYGSGYMHGNEGIFSPFYRAGEGQEPKIAFFAGIPEGNNLYETLPLLSVPMMESKAESEQFTVFTKSCGYYITKTKDIHFAIRIFVNEKKQIVFSLLANNRSKEGKNILLSSYFNPFLVHSVIESGDNRWFREVRYYEEEDSLGYFVVKTNEDLSRTKSISNYGVIKRNLECGSKSYLTEQEETTSRYDYVGGSRGNLSYPRAVKAGTFPKKSHICTFTEVGAAGDLLKLHLGKEDFVRIDITFAYLPYCEDEKKLNAIIKNEIHSKVIDLSLEALIRKEKENSGNLVMKVGSSKEKDIKAKIYNSFFEHLKKQVEFCGLMKGYIQAYVGSLIGIRDIFQALEGLLIWEPEQVRKKMLEALDFTAPNGRCPRQYSLPTSESVMPEMDLRPFIDQGVWVISTIITYLKYTGDFDFLEEECGYYNIVDEKKKLVEKSLERDSVLDHMLRIMNYLLSNRDFEQTKCVRALYGDWNDALDGLGVSLDNNKEYGSGVSVMATLQVYQNLNEMVELLDRLDKEKYQSLIIDYERAKDEMVEGLKTFGIVKEGKEERIVHGWGDKVSYYVGSFHDPDNKSRYGLTSNAFWVLSGLYENDLERKDTILRSFKELDSQYGLKTFHPHFEPDTKGVGRIPKLPAGTAENGASYIHASMFGIMALFRMGHGKEAWGQLLKSLPFTHQTISTSPFIMPNSYSYNEALNLDGESMADWQTGSSNVLLKLIIRYVYGIMPEYDGLWIHPAEYAPFDKMEIEIDIKSCKLHISYEESGSKKEYRVNGVKKISQTDSITGTTKLWISNEELEKGKLDITVQSI